AQFRTSGWRHVSHGRRLRPLPRRNHAASSRRRTCHPRRRRTVVEFLSHKNHGKPRETKKMIRHFKHGLLLVVCLFLCGCGSSRDPKRYHVSGTVTLDGQPMAEGVVRFATFATGVNETFAIKEGKFTGMAADGERRVEIHLLKAEPIVAPG